MTQKKQKICRPPLRRLARLLEFFVEQPVEADAMALAYASPSPASLPTAFQFADEEEVRAAVDPLLCVRSFQHVERAAERA